MNPLRLVQLNEREVGTIHYLAKPLISVGRATSNDIVVNHQQVSRKHLFVRFQQDEDRVVVEDCNSANGVFINGERVTEPTAIAASDTLTIGDIDFMVESVDPQDEEIRDSWSQYDTRGTVDVDDYTSEEAMTAARIGELDALGLRNAVPDEALDQIAQIAATLFQAESGFVSVSGEKSVFYKGAYKLAQREWQRSETPCSWVVEGHAPFWIGEMFVDESMLALPFLSNGRDRHFYAGAPFRGPSGIVIGTVGVTDFAERSPKESQLQALDNLAKFVERHFLLQLEKRRANELHLRLLAFEGEKTPFRP
ncbi:MAG: FHA domain-containing protein [Pirellulaceae bacterium]